MQLCVGAGSRRTVEEAAKLQVPEIVASRAQVNADGGYIGMTPCQLVEVVKDLSSGKTKVVRDHGGPYQSGFKDDGVEAFDIDVKAGFDKLHIDVCKLDRDKQGVTLVKLVRRYGPQIEFEIGGERDSWDWNSHLLDEVVHKTDYTPTHVVVDLGGHIWADRQQGFFDQNFEQTIPTSADLGVRTKAHNMDWYGGRMRFDGHVDAINIAPEYPAVEVDALLTALPPDDAAQLLKAGYDSGAWTRWFGPFEGSYRERAKCGIRYALLRDLGVISEGTDEYLRQEVRDALRRI